MIHRSWICFSPGRTFSASVCARWYGYVLSILDTTSTNTKHHILDDWTTESGDTLISLLKPSMDDLRLQLRSHFPIQPDLQDFLKSSDKF